MPKKQALGRGMDAIFIDNSLESDNNTTKLPIAVIEPRRGQPRRSFDTESLSQLADSIAANGLIQPIVVRRLNGYSADGNVADGSVADGDRVDSEFYQIIAGERRWRAAKLAGLNEVPVVIIEADDRQAAEYALIENIQREDLNPIEEAAAFRSLIDEYGLTQESAAKQVGKSRAAVANSMRLLELPDEVKSLVTEKKLSAGHARALLGLADKSLIPTAADTIVKHELSVRAAEELVKRLNSPKTPKPQNESERAYYADLGQRVSERLGCKVTIKNRGKSRTLSLSCTDTETLEELIKKLAGDDIFGDLS